MENERRGARTAEMGADRTPTVYAWGDFVYDRTSGELLRDGAAVEIAPTPAALLELFLETPGEVLLRSTAWETIWPDERFDLDQKLNYAVHQLRRALGDDAAEPCFVQTLPRRGYRWIAPVEVVETRSGRAAGPGGVSDAGGGGSVASVADVGGVASGEAVSDGRAESATSVGRWTRRLRVATALAATVVLSWGLGTGDTAMDETPTVGTSTGRTPEAPAAPGDPGAVDASVHPAAIEAYRIGEHLLGRRDEGDVELAESYFWSALESDVRFASPWVGLAAVRELAGHRRMAAVLLRRALELDPDHAEAHAVLGRYALDERRWDAAKMHLTAAAAGDPTDSGVHHQLAHRAAMVGDFDAAVAHIEDAMRINPGAALAQGDAGWIYYWAGDPARAVEECSRHQSIGGPNALARACLMSAHLSMGKFDEAAEIARWEMREAGVAADDPSTPEETLQRFFRWRLDTLAELDASLYARARVAAMMGDHDTALRYLERSTGSDEPSVRYALAEPVFRPLHETSGFDRVRRRLAEPVSEFASR